ncbi:histidine phosphatase family protein [Pseudomonas extremaustralis]|jgi:broad specificity phosphatase PhoE|uniref:histidine phosphatase family protein n=1 Tax=Pseudomonas extremaustralis TaxID=359110 RepID=UPI0023DF4947|nr:histidine phosphatase family protein [Pseudomonas extremaustralis]MDF3133557.1 histidine phosphatase family protein [Pseudomonas extremaustralis]
MIPPTLTLHLIRHGETDWNVQKRMQGRRDISLNVLGEAHAKISGNILKWLLPLLLAMDFIASLLLRTRHTMELVRQELALPAHDYRNDERLIEISFGNWEGFTFAGIEKQQPTSLFERKMDTFYFTPMGGENYPAVIERTRSFLQSLQRDTVIVAHAGIVNSLFAMHGDVPAAYNAHVDILQDNACAEIQPRLPGKKPYNKQK